MLSSPTQTKQQALASHAPHCFPRSCAHTHKSSLRPRSSHIHTHLSSSPTNYSSLLPHATVSGPNRHNRTSTVVKAYSNTRSQAFSRYAQPGPYRTITLTPITLPLGQGQSGPISLSVEVVHPVGIGRCPLAIVSPGFLLDSSLFRSYAQQLASWGFACLLYDISELLDDTLTVAYLRYLIDACSTDARLAAVADPLSCYLVGHSRGGKLSALLAAQEPRVKGLCLLDPVDNTPMTPQGVGYPSSLPGLAEASRSRALPVLLLGAAMNGDVIPAVGNYRRFAAACSGPLWDLELSGAGHLQFLDKQPGLFSLFSAPGTTPDSDVRSISLAAMTAFAELVVRPAAGLRPAAAPAFDVMSYAAVERQLGLESQAYARVAPLTYRLTGIGRMGGGSSSSGSGSSSSRAGASARRSASTSSNSSRQYGATAASSATSSSSSGSSSSSSSSSAGGVWAESYAELMQRPARELKRCLVERGVDCSDCFEKSDLANRVLQVAGGRS